MDTLTRRRRLCTYEKRRKVHQNLVMVLGRRIRSLRAAIREDDKVKDQVKRIASLVSSFTGINMRRWRYVDDVEGARDAKRLYYKYGLENGASHKRLMSWIGVTRRGESYEYRRRFTLSLSTNPKHRALWDAFKVYVADKDNDSH